MGAGPEIGCIKIADLGMARLFNSPLKVRTRHEDVASGIGSYQRMNAVLVMEDR